MEVLEFCSYSNEFYCYSHPDILFEAFSTLRPGGLSEGEMLVKLLKIKDFYEFNFCSNTIVSTWLEMTASTSAADGRPEKLVHRAK